MPDTIFDRHYYLFRRLHSLTGIMPAGAFLLSHLTTNASILWGHANGKWDGMHGGAAEFQHEVDFIHSIPFLLLIEIFGLWIPIGFHALLGLYYAKSGRSNVASYGYGGNVRYSLQRLSGYVGIVFILYHIATLRWGWTFLVPGGTEWSAEFAGSTMGAVMQGGDSGITAMGLAVACFYFLGVSLLVYHFANGLWTAGITWGLTVSAAAQRRWGYVCAGLGTGLMLAGWAAILGFATLNVDEARETEIRMSESHAAPPLEVEALSTATREEEH
ncbi:MAG: hypothetical protein KDA21_03070 [Phycisphaerales bacterium]|nr:hypothetical protein [Phycisphaerales bacterium]